MLWTAASKQLCGQRLSLPDQKGFPGGLVVKNPPANGGDTRDLGWIPGSEEPLEEGMAPHSSILAWEVPDRGDWRATFHGVAESRARLSTRASKHTSSVSKQRTLRPSTLGPCSRPECAPGEESGWRRAGPWPQVAEGQAHQKGQLQ